MLLEVKNLTTVFQTGEGTAKAVDDVSFYLNKGETLGLVGESGCGKSVIAHSILHLIPDPPGKITNGEILFKGKNLLKLSEKQMRSVRGNQIGMIFQEPMTSLNPVYTCGNQIEEALIIHNKSTGAEAKNRAIEMLDLVGIPSPQGKAGIYYEYPHRLSGGMRQRVLIAIALACNPEILIADEPTTALDVTIQAQILELISNLRQKLGMGVLLITHDLGVIAETADRVIVMYASKIVESGKIRDVFKSPSHPYTIGLLDSIPNVNNKKKRLTAIEGNVPSPFEYPKGCHFQSRCKLADERCRIEKPMLTEVSPGHFSACFNIALIEH